MSTTKKREQIPTISEADINGALEKNRAQATELLKDADKTELFLQRLEKKLSVIPVAGKILSEVPVLISLVRNYIKKEYTAIPLGSIIAIVSALIYILSPVDILPDVLPVVGYVDDAAILLACWKLIDSDIKEYIEWREASGGKDA